MKLCRTCNIEKDLFKFGNRKASPDGLSPKCKSCASKYDKLRAKNPDRVATRLAYSKTPEGIKAGNEAKKRWQENNKSKTAESRIRYREKNPKKLMCHGIVGYAIKCKTLIKKPCEICGEFKSHGHHDDYDKPLEVRWLCSKHHHEWHSNNREGLNAI